MSDGTICWANSFDSFGWLHGSPIELTFNERLGAYTTNSRPIDVAPENVGKFLNRNTEDYEQVSFSSYKESNVKEFMETVETLRKIFRYQINLNIKKNIQPFIKELISNDFEQILMDKNT